MSDEKKRKRKEYLRNHYNARNNNKLEIPIITANSKYANTSSF